MHLEQVSLCNVYCILLRLYLQCGSVYQVFLPHICLFAANSPVKGYVRTKVRQLFEVMARRHNCTVTYIDEFRTTKLCSFCFRTLEQPRRYGVVHKKYRYYTCRKCTIHEHAFKAMGWVLSKKSNRLLSKQRIECPRRGIRMASKFKLYRQIDDFAGVWPPPPRNMTWNRDINAARNIRYKGNCLLQLFFCWFFTIRSLWRAHFVCNK